MDLAITRDRKIYKPIHATSNSINSVILHDTIESIIISDHAPLTLSINLNIERTIHRWRMNISLPKEQEFYFRKEWESFLELNDTLYICNNTLGDSKGINEMKDNISLHI